MATAIAQSASKRRKPTPPPQGPKGYKGHIKGSRKEQVHRVYDKSGPEAANKKGLALKLKPGTLTSWFGAWRRADEAAKSKKRANGTRKPTRKKATRRKRTGTK